MDSKKATDRQKQTESNSPLALLNLLEQSHIGVILLSKDGQPIFCNAALENLLGCKLDHLVTIHCTGLAYPGEPEIGIWLLRDLRNATKSHTSIERRYVRSDNSQIWVRITLSPVELKIQRTEYYVAIIEDIGSYKLIKQFIKSSSFMPKQNEYSVIITDKDYRIEFWNQGAQSLYQWTSQEACGKDIVQLLSLPQNRNKCYKINRQVLVNSYWEGEVAAQAKDGHQVVLRLIKTLLNNSQGAADKIITISFDITERYNLLSNLQKNYQFLISLLSKQTSQLENTYRLLQQEIKIRQQAELDLSRFYNISLDLFCIIDFDGYLQKCNTSFCKILGYTEQQLNNKKVNKYIHPADRHRTFSTILKVTSTGQGVTNFINRCRCNDDNYLWLEWTVVPFMSEGVFYAVARDITAKKQLEAELSRMERLHLVGHMATNIGHELRNPLTTVKGFLQYMQNKDDCSQYHSVIELMLNEIDRSDTIIKDYLSLAKDKLVELQEKDLNLLIRKMIPELQAKASVANKSIRFHLGDITPILLDEKEIRRLISNLVGNGLDAVQHGQEVIIKTYRNSCWIILEISDEGLGIDPAIVEKIGTPFLTTKETRIGLGLAVCYSIAYRHNAQIDFYTGNDGTTFFIRFPLSPSSQLI